MESLNVAMIGISLLCIASAVVVTLFAHKAYALITALTLTVQSIALTALIDAVTGMGALSSEIVWIFFVVEFALLYLFVKLTWLSLWWCITLAAWLLIYSILGVETMLPSIKLYVIVGVVIGIIGTYFLHKYARVVVVSSIAGMNLYTGVAILLFPALFTESLTLWQYLNLGVMILGVGGALYYHFKINTQLLDGSKKPAVTPLQPS